MKMQQARNIIKKYEYRICLYDNISLAFNTKTASCQPAIIKTQVINIIK